MAPVLRENVLSVLTISLLTSMVSVSSNVKEVVSSNPLRSPKRLLPSSVLNALKAVINVKISRNVINVSKDSSTKKENASNVRKTVLYVPIRQVPVQPVQKVFSLPPRLVVSKHVLMVLSMISKT